MKIDWNKVKEGLSLQDVIKAENKELREENNRLESIIKEAREYVDKWENVGRYKLLEILDKEDK